MILFESFSEIENILKRYGIKNYTIDNEGLVNVDGDVNLSSISLTKIPVKFGRVTGNFGCHYNQLKSLEGAPKEVSGSFDCSNNKLTSLLGAPKEVGGNFSCSYNQLTSLEGAPKEVGGDFGCSGNQLASLLGSPGRVGGDYICLVNNIISFEGVPKHVGGDFNCFGNPISEIWRLFRDYSKIELLNDYDAIQDGVIILDRLNDFLITIGKKPVDSVYDWKCI